MTGARVVRATLAVTSAGALLAACATTSGGAAQAWMPQIDAKGVDTARYERDLAECRALAAGNPDADAERATKKAAMKWGVGSAAALGVATVATGGLAAVAALPAIAGNAALIVGTGAVAGGASAKVAADAKYQSIIGNCLTGRGYRVLG